MLRHKGYSAINAIGLSVGLTCCILVLLYVQNEFQYDAFHRDADRIYRLLSEARTKDGLNVHAGTSGPLGPVLFDELPEVEAYMRVYLVRVWFRTKNNVNIERFCLADPGFFEF